MKSTPSGAEPPVRGRKNIIHFENGIYGFETVKDFILLKQDEGGAVWSLQAADADYPSLIVVNPFLIFPDYSPALSAAERKRLGNPPSEDLCFLTVAVIKRNLADSVVNLKSPVVINVPRRIGRQVILEDNDYPVRCRLFRGAAAGRE